MIQGGLRNVDLNLLVAFSALMRERSVSRAAARLFLGQSGMSGALARLRVLFTDPLLVRVGRKLEPTPRALELIEQVDQALGLVEHAVAGTRSFTPATSTRAFSVAMSDNHELLFGAALARAFFEAAPLAQLILRDVQFRSVRAVLDDGETDAAVSVISEVPSWHRAESLFDQIGACIWSPQALPRLGGVARGRSVRRLTMTQFTSVDHALVTYRGDLRGVVDEALEQAGERRNVVVGVSRFAALPALLRARPLLATVPMLTAVRFVRDHRLAMALPPIPNPSRSVYLVYRERDAALPELRWFRELVTHTVQAVVRSTSQVAASPVHRSR
jgi:LysR family transcriptional regulator, mexEF-oprN operon transcriptional activator